MLWWYIALSAGGGLALAVLLSLLTIRWLGRREPYAGFIRLRTRRKLTFLRLLLQDKRVPLFVKLLPFLVAVYVISPIDLIPGIPLDDIAVALLALALIIKMTPRPVIQDLLRQAQESDARSPGGGAPMPGPHGASDA